MKNFLELNLFLSFVVYATATMVDLERTGSPAFTPSLLDNLIPKNPPTSPVGPLPPIFLPTNPPLPTKQPSLVPTPDSRLPPLIETGAPTGSTPAPIIPTGSPVNPTLSPVVPSSSPVDPTTAPVDPTPAPVVPLTPAPIDPPTGGSSGGGSGIEDVLYEDISDNQAKFISAAAGVTGLSTQPLGFAIAFEEPLYTPSNSDVSFQRGVLYGLCTKISPTNSSFSCQLSFHFGRGTILAAGILQFRGNNNFTGFASTIPIVGGTGEYTGVSGSIVHFYQHNNGEYNNFQVSFNIV